MTGAVPLRHYFLATIVMSVAALFAMVLSQVLLWHSALMVFLLGVLFVGARTSTRPALWSALLGFLAYNFLFTEPRYSFQMFHRDDLLLVCFFLLLSGVTGNLAARSREQLIALQQSQSNTSQLLELSNRLAVAIDVPGILSVAREFLNRRGAGKVWIVDASQVADDADTGDLPKWSQSDRTLLKALFHADRVKEGQLRQAEHYCFYPLLVNQRVRFVVVQEKLASGCHDDHSMVVPCQQIALALDRLMLLQDLEEARMQQETERLRSALLSSVSHDLKTPLASMIGATSSLLQYDDRLSKEDRRELLDATLQEAERLSRYIQNLLDMTRLGYGELKLERDWVAPADIVASALHRLADLTAGLTLKTSLPEPLPLLYVHGALIEQALVNVLENAVRFSPARGVVQVQVQWQEPLLSILVQDEGPGIPPAERERVFDMFYSIEKGDRRTGTGLGLAICKAMLGAHGGTVAVVECEGGLGTCIRMTLDLSSQPKLEPVDEG
jgi:two-component system sensor histidine kinase KdpD